MMNLRRAAELVLFGLAGLLLGIVMIFYGTIRGWVPNELLFYRVTLPIVSLGTPGLLVGTAVGWLLDVGGFTTNWKWLDTVTGVASAIGNAFIFAGVWAGLRYSSPKSRTRLLVTALLVVWCLFTSAVVVVGEIWASG